MDGKCFVSNSTWSLTNDMGGAPAPVRRPWGGHPVAPGGTGGHPWGRGFARVQIGIPATCGLNPKDLKARAKVNEAMDWLNTNFYREYGYGFIYPQVFPHHRRPGDDVHNATVAWGRDKAKGWLQILNDYWIGPNRNYLCGNEITIADYLGAGLVSLGEVVRCDFATYPNVKRW